MSKIHNKQGYSRLELICSVGIGLILIFFIFTGIRWHHNSLAKGDDSLKVNSAESVAAVNLMENGCVVNGCERSFDGRCEHTDRRGRTIGYYDAVKKKIFADVPRGYNEFSEMRIGEEKYTGDVGAMVIRVTGDAGQVTLDWVKGDRESCLESVHI